MAFFKKFRDAQRPCCAALVAAAGSSSRMGGVNKLLQPLDGIPVLARTLTALQMARRIDEIVVAAREEDFLEISQLCRTYGITKCTKVIRGGESRAHSVLLAALEAGEGMELLAVQDGARPLVTPALIDRTVAQWQIIKNKEFYYIMTAAEESDTVMDCTLECFRGLARCLEGSIERGVIYGKGVYGPGEIESKPAMREAYDMGRTA